MHETTELIARKVNSRFGVVRKREENNGYAMRRKTLFIKRYTK